MDTNVQNNSYQASPTQQFEQIMQQVDPNTRQWAYSHQQDLMSPDKAQLAMSAAQFAYSKGYVPGSDDFISFMDEQLGYNKRQNRQEQNVNTNNRTDNSYMNYSAPSRSSSNNSKRVYLDEDDRRLAASSNMTEEQWAKNKAETEKIFKKNGWDCPGITHFNV